MSDITKARGLYYFVLSEIFNPKNTQKLIPLLESIIENPLDTASQNATIKILESIKNNTFVIEFDNIFTNPEHKILHTTASYYIEGYESGKPRVAMNNIIALTPIRRDEESYKDNEDSVAFIFAFLSYMLKDGDTSFSENISSEGITKRCFVEILNPFIDDFISTLYLCQHSDIYKSVAILMTAFIELERLHLSVEKPAKVEKKAVKKEVKNKKPKSLETKAVKSAE